MGMDSAVKGLAILTAIPVVMLAIWADYFGQKLAELTKENPHYDRATELYKIRLAGICAIFFQFGIFMGTGAVRQEAPVVANLFFVVGVLLQSVIQSAVENKLRKPTERLRAVDAPRTNDTVTTPKASEDGAPAEQMDLALRAFFWASVGGALYLAGFALPVIIVSWCAQFLHASQPVMTGLVITSAIAGMLGGVAINFALGAFYLRKMLPAHEVAPGELRTGLEACFSKAGLPAPTYWVLETGRKREATAMMAGFPTGRGLLRPGLFLSRGLLDNLNAEEVRAVVLHEASHVKLTHLYKRLLYSAVLVVGTTALATFCVFLASIFLPDSDARSFIGFGAAAGAFVLTFKLLSKQSQIHEFEADMCSVAILGADVESLISALRKLDQVNGKSARLLDPLSITGESGHPPTERRVAALRARFPEGGAARASDSSSDNKDDRRAA
jgi:heat shock protein HtpX